MAEGEGNLGQQRAVSLLQEATRLIREWPGSSNNVSSAQVASPNVISQSESHATTSSGATTLSGATTSSGVTTVRPVNTSNRERVLGNFRNLFAPYGNTGRRSLSSSTQLAQPSSKRRKTQSAAAFRRETWTHVFFCLANREQCVTPTVTLKAKLQQAGLGREKICFNWKATALEVKAKLEQVYPKLSHSGGFDILRRGVQTSDLVFIQPPRSGYSVAFLRDTAGLGQAIAFIRPIQNNLDITPAMDSSEVSHQGIVSVHTIMH
jgi:hypothetical protein